MMNEPVILYDNRLFDGTPTATDTDSGSEYDVLNIRDLRPYTWWKAGSAGTKYITIDCGSTKSVDAMGIFSHNLGTAAASVSVESSGTGAWAGEEVQRLAPFTPSSDLVILKLFTSASAQHWRIKIVTATVIPQIAVSLLGERMTFEKRLQGDFDPNQETIEGTSQKSKTGQILGEVVRFHSLKILPAWRELTPSWISSTFVPAWNAHIKLLKPFLWAWNPDIYPDEVYLVKVPDNFTRNMPWTRNRRSLSLELEGISE